MSGSLSCVFQLSRAQVLLGFLKQFINNIIFPTCACTAGFNNNNMRFLRYGNVGRINAIPGGKLLKEVAVLSTVFGIVCLLE